MSEARWPFVPHDGATLDVQIKASEFKTFFRHELDLALAHAREDLLFFHDKRRTRRELAALRRKREQIARAVDELIALVDGPDNALPLVAGAFLAIRTAPEFLEPIAGRSGWSGGKPRDDAVASIGMLHGREILADMLKAVRDGFRQDQSLAAVDHGGMEPDYDRQRLLDILADTAPAILGRRATATAGGPFQRLVAAVVAACDLEDTGIEKLVERTLARRPKKARAKEPS